MKTIRIVIDVAIDGEILNYSLSKVSIIDSDDEESNE